MLLLDNPIQPYAWGPVDGIAGLVGSAPTGGHEAELWVGTHPRGPSVVVGGEHDGRTLAEVIADDPARWLGEDVASTGARALPFLLKVLAIGAPLSLQVHPSAEQAAEGYQREEAAGIPSDAPHRLYADPFPKPEVLVSISGTHVLTGFRAPDEAAELLARLDEPLLAPLLDALRGPDAEQALRDALEWVLRLQGDARVEVARAAVAAAVHAGVERRDERHADAEAKAAELRAQLAPGDRGRLPDVPAVLGDPLDPYAWVVRLGAEHPDDPSCLAPLLLQLRWLMVGDAVELPAGNLHAYLRGAGVEVMGASDNVLRGGLTPKHVDVEELLRVVRFEPLRSGTSQTVELLRGVPGMAGEDLWDFLGATGTAHHLVRVYDAGQEEFGLVSIQPSLALRPFEPAGPRQVDGEPGPQDSVVRRQDGVEAHPFQLLATQPSLLLAVGGEIELSSTDGSVRVGHGRAVFVAPGGPPVTVTGTGTLWWATTRAGLPAI